jgi:hypothetical protein
MGQVAIGYVVEQVVISFVAILVLIFASLQYFFAWKLHEPITLLHKSILSVIFIFGILELIWSVDPRGVWRFYSPFVIALLRDWIILCLLQAAFLWADLLLRSISFFISSIRHYNRWPIMLTSVSPILLLVVLSAALSYKASSTGDYLYRVIFTFSEAVVILLFSAFVLMSQLYLRQVMKSARGNNSADRGQFDGPGEYKKLFRAGLLFITLSVVGIGFSFQNYLTKRTENSFSSSQTVSDPAIYAPYTFFAAHMCGIAIVLSVIWLPLKVEKSRS